MAGSRATSPPGATPTETLDEAGRRRARVYAFGLVTVAALAVAVILATPDRSGGEIRGLLRHFTAVHVLIVLAGVAALTLLPRSVRVPSGRLPTDVKAAFDVLPWPIAAGTLAAVAGAVWYALGRVVTVPYIFDDELTHGWQARALALHGVLAPHGYGYVTPIVDSIAYLTTGDDVSAYRFIQALNVGVMVTAAFPAFLLARRIVSHRWALGVALLTVAVPWMSYSASVMTEPHFYPLFLLFVLALVRTLESPTLGHQVVLVLALVLVYATRTQALVLAAAIPVAAILFGLSRRRGRATLRALVPVWIVYAAGGAALLALGVSGRVSLLGSYSIVLHQALNPSAVLRWTALAVTTFSLSVGGLTTAAAFLGFRDGLRRSSDDASAAVAAAAIPSILGILGTVVVLSASPFGLDSTHERNLFVVAPLLFAGALSWARNASSSRPAIVAAAALLGALALLAPHAALLPKSESSSVQLWSQLHLGTAHLALAFAVGLALSTLLLLRVRAPWTIAVVIALVLAAGTGSSAIGTADPRPLVPRYAWVDRTLGPGETATIVSFARTPSCASAGADVIGHLVTMTEFFDGSVSDVGVIGGSQTEPEPPTRPLTLSPHGVLDAAGEPVRTRFVIADSRVRFSGRRIASLSAADVLPGSDRASALTLWRVKQPLRLKGCHA